MSGLRIFCGVVLAGVNAFILAVPRKSPWKDERFDYFGDAKDAFSNEKFHGDYVLMEMEKFVSFLCKKRRWQGGLAVTTCLKPNKASSISLLCNIRHECTPDWRTSFVCSCYSRLHWTIYIQWLKASSIASCSAAKFQSDLKLVLVLLNCAELSNVIEGNLFNASPLLMWECQVPYNSFKEVTCEWMNCGAA